MSVPNIVIVDHEFLALIPTETTTTTTTEEDGGIMIPLVRLRDLPSVLGRCRSRLHSCSKLLDNREKLNTARHLSSIRMEERPLRALRGESHSITSRRKENGSFGIPGGSVQIYATGKQGTYLMTRNDNNNCVVQVSNTSGYWTTDFCSVGGYQQVLWLPVVEYDNIPSSATTAEQWSIDTAKRLLANTICHCTLTDGIDVFLSPYQIVEQTRTPFSSSDCCPNIVLLSITGDDDVLRQCQADEAAHMQLSPSVDNESESESNAARSTAESQWMKVMERAIESRLIMDRKEYERRVRAQQMKRLMLTRNRKALQELLNPDGTSVQAGQVRYRTMPSGRRSVFLFMEIDLVASCTVETLCHLHLSCSPMSTNDNSLVVRTHSGIVPNLQNGTCVTVIAIVEVNDIVLKTEAERGTPVFVLSVEAHWTEGRADSGRISRTEAKRRASHVGQIPLSLESLLLQQQEWTRLDSTSVGTVETLPVPSAIYDCRKPYRIVIDVSYCSPIDWKAWTESFNSKLKGTGHWIDLCEVGGSTNDDTFSILLFPFPAEDLSGLAALVKNHLPDLVIVVHDGVS